METISVCGCNRGKDSVAADHVVCMPSSSFWCVQFAGQESHENGSRQDRAMAGQVKEASAIPVAVEAIMSVI